MVMRWVWGWLLCCVAVAAALEPNLLTNGGMEGDDDQDGVANGWVAEVHHHEGGEGVFALDSQTKMGRRFSQRIVHTSQRGWVRASQTGIPAQPSARYLFRCWVKADCRFLLIVYTFRNGGKYETFIVAEGSSTNGEWRLFSGVVLTPPDARSFKVSLITDSKGTAWFDEAELVLLDRPPYAFVSKAKVPPKLDGDLSDDCWHQAEPMTPFLELGTHKIAMPPTVAKLAMTETHLFVAFHCAEPNPSALRLHTPESGEPAYRDDCVEVYLDPMHSHDGFLQFVVTPKANTWSQRVEPSHWARVWWLLPRPVPQIGLKGWQAAAQIKSDHWTAELAIPFALLGIQPRAGEVIGINLCRSRKAGQSEQNSAFAYFAPEATFQRPSRFPHLVLLSDDATEQARFLSTLDMASENRPANLFQRLVPRPQRVVVGEAMMPITASVRILIPSDASPLEREGVQLLLNTLKRVGVDRYTVAPLTAKSTAVEPSFSIVLATLEQLPAELRMALPFSKLRTFFAQRGDEAYAMFIKAQSVGRRAKQVPQPVPSITIVGASPRGVFYGLQTLRQLLFFACAEGKPIVLPSGEIWDYPDLKLRGWHFIAPFRHELTFAEQWLEWMGLMKFNTLVVEVDDRFPYERHPQVAHPQAMTKEQWQRFLERARRLGFEVIPQVQTFGHFRYVLEKPAYRHLSELSEPHPRWGLFAYCPSNPETYRVVFDLFDEVLAVFQPRWFHIGHDEITFVPIGICERCEATGKPAWQLLADDIRRLYEYLKGKGVERVAMWCDQLEPDRTGGYSPFFTHFAADLIPKDIVLFCWHYDARPSFPWLSRNKEKGFEVVACGWYHTQNVWRFAAESFDRRTLGYCGTTWYGITGFANAVDLMSAVVLAAQNAWSVDNPPVEQASHPTNLAHDLWALVGERPRWSEGIQGFAPVNLSRFTNASFFQHGEQRVVPDWFGGAIKLWTRVPFALSVDGHQSLRVVLLAGGETPHEVAPDLVAIPINAPAKALYLLMSTTARLVRTEDIYQRGTIDPRKVATLIVRYADGMEAREELLYRWHLTEWNDRLGCSHARMVWQGKTKRGYLVTLCAYEWRNPRPDTPIAFVILLSANSSVQPVLVGLTVGR